MCGGAPGSRWLPAAAKTRRDEEAKMATTRELVVRALESNGELRRWFEEQHDFDLGKARSVDLTEYGDYVSVILREGLRSGVVSPSEVAGREP
jgi:hypothetical protein